MSRRAAVLVALAVAAAGCRAGEAEPASEEHGKRASSPGMIAPRKQPYEAVAVVNGGSIAGMGSVDSTMTLASTSMPANPGCAPGPVAPTGTPATIAWADGIDRGKPLPIERRYEVVSEECVLTPRVSAVIAGGTINVRNDDRAIHRLVFVRQGGRDTVQVMPFSNTGQLVASDRLARTPGLIEVRCAEHQGVHGYIAVFDHPYFTVVSGAEEFTIDSVPVGSYTMMTWTEGAAKSVARPVRVGTDN